MLIYAVLLVSVTINAVLISYILNRWGNDNSSVQKARLEAIIEEKERKIAELLRSNEGLRDVLSDNRVLEDRNNSLLLDLEKMSDYDSLKLENKTLEAKLARQEEDLNRMREEITLNFKSISHDIVEKQSENFTKTQREIFKHFNEDVKNFMIKVEENTKTSNINKASMEEQLKIMINNSINLAKEASDLTNALKGNKKIQGNWGEIQLERIIEMVGLKEGIDYTKQGRITIDGKTYVPDYIINLPNNRKVIVDSKVSLNNYIEYTKAETTEEKNRYLKMYVNDIKQHINELSDKEYQKIVKESSLDYVFMFLPLEHAYIDAIDNDSSIYELSFKKHVAIATPSSLFPIIKTIENLWNIERQNKDVDEIVKIGRDLYEKVASFISDMENIKSSIDKLNKSYENANNKLCEGRGNILRLTEKLKSHGISTDKDLLKYNKKVENVDE